MKESRTEYRRKDAATERGIREELARLERDALDAWRRSRAAEREAEAARVRFTRGDLVGAVVVKSKSHGWRKVRKVNQKTVSVDSGYSWADLIPFADVLDYRT